MRPLLSAASGGPAAAEHASQDTRRSDTAMPLKRSHHHRSLGVALQEIGPCSDDDCADVPSLRIVTPHRTVDLVGGRLAFWREISK